MQEPKRFLDIILNDPYATRQSHEAALKLFNMVRRQNTRRKRCRERMEVLDKRIEELETVLQMALKQTEEPCPPFTWIQKAEKALERDDG